MRKLSLTNTFPDMVTLTNSAIVCHAKVFAAFRDFFEGFEFKKGDMIRDSNCPDICLRVMALEPAGYLIKRQYNPFGDPDNFIVPFERAERWAPIVHKGGV